MKEVLKMSAYQRIGRSALVVVAAVAGVLGAAGAANATPEATADTLAPTCLQHWQATSGTIHVENDCKSTQHFKLIIRFGPDSSCHTLKPRGKYTWNNWSNNLEKIIKC